MNERPYQSAASQGIDDALAISDSTLAVLATGLGKTVLFAHAIKRRLNGSSKRAMVIAHREELIWQASNKIRAVTGEQPDVEMADFRADVGGWFGETAKKKVVVASVQTLNAGQGDGRMAKFNPSEFGLLVIDEAHHATASTYRQVINHFRQNPDCKVLGVTATPDRADEEALGKVFQTVAFEYGILEGIQDGWLAPINQTSVAVSGLDFSSIRTTAGDLNGADLASVMEYEQNLHEVAGPTIEIAGHRKTLVFAASVHHAERLCEILNRHRAASARWISGETPKEERRQIFADYSAGRFQFLVNVGVATEGFDEPTIEVIVMARPTKSRALYTQMAGRGTRTLPGIVDRYNDPELRRNAIALSAKPAIEIIDFVGNSGKHKLICTADILGDSFDDDVVERTARKARESGKSVNMLEALEEAKEQKLQEAQEAKRREAARRAHLRVNAKYAKESVDPFDLLRIVPERERGWDVGKRPTDKMVAFLAKQGIDNAEKMPYRQASQLISELTKRFDSNKCTLKMATTLARYGYSPDTSFTEARTILDTLAKNGWRRPDAPKVKVY